MDISSYLLGKKNGGGGGGASTDWSVIGYNNEPEGITNEISLAKDIYDNWDASVTSCNFMFDNRKDLQIMPLVDTSNCTDFSNMFYRCTFLSVVPSLDTSKGTNFSSMFNNCQAIKTIPKLDLSSAININGMFSSCSQLKNLYGFKDLGKAYEITAPENMSNYTLPLGVSSNLTHQSVINVFNDLYDIASKGCNHQKITIISAVYNTLTPEEIAIATDKGWNVVSS